MLIKHLSFVFMLMAYMSCSNKTSTSTSNEAGKSAATESLPVKDFEKEGYIKAVVINMTELDGCDHLLQLESGKKLQPTTLAQEFKEDKLRVWVKYSVSKGLASICMSGTMVNLSAIEKRQ